MYKKNPDDFYISTYPKTVKVKELKKWINDFKISPNVKLNLIDVIYHRLYIRYIKLLINMNSDEKLYNGFLIMAVACLLIEAFESFYQGINNSNGSQKMFLSFFNREIKYFPQFNDLPNDIDSNLLKKNNDPIVYNSCIFYKHIRCGILHQAETTGGWKLNNYEKDILNINMKYINPVLFIKNISKCIDDYKNNLLDSDFDSLIWNNAIKKLLHICDNCK